MNKIEQLHLEAIESCEQEEIKNSAIYKMDFPLAASKSAEITKGIAIEFLKYYEETAVMSYFSTCENHGKPIDEVYEEFLKTSS